MREDVVIVLDGACGVCSRVALLIDRHDRTRKIRIATHDTEPGATLMRENGLDPTDPETWLLLEDGHAFTHLDVLVRLGLRLGGVFRLLFLLMLLPRRVNRRAYQAFAIRRRHLLGRTPVCSVPSRTLRARLLVRLPGDGRDQGRSRQSPSR